ncbi:NAD(P)H-dependent oxidoreductase [Roseovarius sp.]|uniref:NADPH-dependent FMN reductase n=1 Tax=Roseovarius sp. TaxID=1486281 RepID=UPI002635CB59|nr:NAD(P)H-dependent oxidoreductase [Roseovarius sp.]MDM8168534.1 NAD(P)H-dependent oxidoreductase [Roseovarius sp.]
MAKALTFAVISGSLRKESFSTKIADSLHELVPEGVTVVPQDIHDIPLYNEDLKTNGSSPAQVQDLAQAIEGADAVVISSPEYNRGTSGVLKNVIDWMSKEPNTPFAGKPVLIITQSPSATGGLTAQYDLRKMLSVINAEIVPGFEIAVSKSNDKINDGKLTHDDTKEFIADNLSRLANRIRG